MKTLFLIAFRNILSHGRRSLILGGAIAGVTTLLVFLGCLSTGVKATIVKSATTVATGHLNVSGFYKVTAGQSAPLVTDYRKIEAIVKKTLPDLDFVTSRGRGWARLVSDEHSMQVGMAGVEIEHEPRLKSVLHILEGNYDELGKPGSVLIFADQAKKFKVKVGDNMTFSVLTPRGVNNTVDVRVCAIAEDMGMMSGWNVFVPQETLRRLYQMNDEATGAVLIYLKDMAKPKIEADIALMRKALEAAGYTMMDRDGKAFWMKLQEVNREEWTGQKLDLSTWEDEISYISWTRGVIDAISVLLSAVLLIIIAIGIMNSMWIAIRERTREIGTLRAIGMQKGLVMQMFVYEALLLGAMGTAAGALAGVALSLVANALKVPVPQGAQFFLMSSTMQFGFDGGRIFISAFIITLCTTLISLIPSFKAARLKPVTAMSHI